MSYWSIFWRTFAQLAASALLAVQALDWVSDFQASAEAMGLALLGALVGGLVAAGWAFVRSPAVSALDKALRSAVQALLGVVTLFAYNSVADVVSNVKLLVASIGSIIVAGLITYFQNQGTVPQPPVAEEG